MCVVSVPGLCPSHRQKKGRGILNINIPYIVYMMVQEQNDLLLLKEHIDKLNRVSKKYILEFTGVTYNRK